MMLDIIAFSVFELASRTRAVAENLPGYASVLLEWPWAGEWGVGAALVFVTLPAKGRGFFSGLLQEGYVVGYLLAALAYGAVFPILGWRGMFVIGALPAFLIIYIRSKVAESPAWLSGRGSNPAPRHVRKDIVTYLGSFLFLVLLMFTFNSFSHGTQDSCYPTFLQVNHGLSPRTVGEVAVIYNLGALLGGILFGTWSKRIGRRKNNYPGVLARAPSHSAVGLFAHGTDARSRRIRDAIHGTRRLGRDSRSSK